MKIYHVEIYAVLDNGDLGPVREVRVEADNYAQAERIASRSLWAGEFVDYVTHAYGE